MVSSGHHSFALQGIIVHLELCSLPSTSVLWGHGVGRVDWKLRGSASHVHGAGTAWLGLGLLLADAALDTSVRKVDPQMSMSIFKECFLCEIDFTHTHTHTYNYFDVASLGTAYGIQFPCPVGTYSIQIGNRRSEDCLICPEGSFCHQGTSKPSPCPP